MDTITAVSQINAQNAAEYLRIAELSSDDEAMLNTLINVATTFIANYTGQPSDKLDDFPSFVIVALILIQDMWDNRALYVDKTNLNVTVETILGMHSVNLLPTVGGNDD